MEDTSVEDEMRDAFPSVYNGRERAVSTAMAGRDGRIDMTSTQCQSILGLQYLYSILQYLYSILLL